MIEIKIKKLETENEVEQCTRILRSSEPWNILRDEYKISRETIKDPNRDIYLAIHEEEIHGCIIMVRKGEKVGFIQSVCVPPSNRRRGIATQLILFAEELFGEDRNQIYLQASTFNPGALRLYKRLGYQVVGELPDNILRGESDLLLKKTKRWIFHKKNPLTNLEPR